MPGARAQGQHAPVRRNRWASLLLLGLTRSAAAQDVGDIAVVPDTANNIISSAALGSRYMQRSACAFYQSHADRYDALFIFTSAQLNMLTRTPQGWPVQVAASGIGRDFYPVLRNTCSTRLKQVVKLGDLDAFPDDPDAQYTGVFDFTLTGVQLLGHEFGHYWLASIRFDKGDGLVHCLARGFTPSEGLKGEECDHHPLAEFNQHWSYYFNSGSVMYGNQIRDLGNGSFELSSPNPGYGPLDQYLMGLRDPAEVPVQLIVDTGMLSAESSSFPLAPGQTEVVQGTALEFTVADVVRVEGPRVPARDPCHWKAAFMIVHPAGSPPTAAQIAKADRYRARWESFYAAATSDRGSADTTLAGTGLGTAACPAGAEPPLPDGGIAPSPDGGGRDSEPAPDAEPAAGDAEAVPDSGGLPLADAGVEPGPEATGPRVIGLEDCSCTAARGGGESRGWVAGLVGLGWLARRMGEGRRRNGRSVHVDVQVHVSR